MPSDDPTSASYWRNIFGLEPPAGTPDDGPVLPHSATATTSGPSSTTSTAGTAPTLSGATNDFENLIKGFGGQTDAGKLFTPGSMGTITDPRSADMQSYIDSLKSGASMTPAEEQGQSDINRQIAAAREQAASIGGSQGLSGGVIAGLQMNALNQGSQSMADYMRGLAINNQQQLGGALQNQQNVELGIETANNNLRNQEAYGRAAFPLQEAAAAQGMYGSEMGNYLGQEGIDTQNKYISELPSLAGNNGGINLSGLTPAQSKNLAGALSNKDATPGERQTGYNTISAAAGGTDYGSSAPGRATVNSSGNPPAAGGGNGGVPAKGGTLTPPHKKCGPGGACHLVTAATDMGFVPPNFLANAIANCPTKRQNFKAYNMWGPLMADAVRTNRFFHWLGKQLIKPTANYMLGNKSVRGAIGYYGIYMTCSLACRAYLWVKKHA